MGFWAKIFGYEKKWLAMPRVYPQDFVDGQSGDIRKNRLVSKEFCQKKRKNIRACLVAEIYGLRNDDCVFVLYVYDVSKTEYRKTNLTGWDVSSEVRRHGISPFDIVSAFR